MRFPVRIWIEERNSAPEEIAGYFIEIARRMDEHPRKMRLEVRTTVPVSLDFDPADGMPEIESAGGKFKFDMRRRWIPEHPVPLVFAPGKKTVALIDPAEGNRFKVRAGTAPRIPAWFHGLFAVSAAVAVVTFHPAAVAVAAAILLMRAVLAVWYNPRIFRPGK